MLMLKSLKEYLKNSTIHGAKFILVLKASWIESIFWFLCITISLLFSWKLIEKARNAFETNAISFGMDTAYRDWNTDFPAVIICESKNLNSVQKTADKLWGINHDISLDEVLSEIAFFRGQSYYTIRICGTIDPKRECLYSNFSYFAQLVRHNCTELIRNCTWNSQRFECCKYFQHLETEFGDCHAINSLQTRHHKKLDMISNRQNGLGLLKFDLKHESEVFILGEEEVPALSTPKTHYLSVGPNMRFIRKISKHDIKNDENIQYTNVLQRRCLFNFEKRLDVYKYYSYSACRVQCRKDRQLKMCNCSSHFTPNSPNWEKCDVKGLQCLENPIEKNEDFTCECLPSCTEVEITTVYNYKESFFNKSATSIVEIALIEFPTERFKRNVIRSKLELIVSIGGITGLFLGASLLSFIEFFYYLILRPYLK